MDTIEKIKKPVVYDQERPPSNTVSTIVGRAESRKIRGETPHGYKVVAVEQTRASDRREKRRVQDRFNTRMDRLLAMGSVAVLLGIAGVVFPGKPDHATSRTPGRPAQPINTNRMISPVSNFVLTPGLKPAGDLDYLPRVP